MRTDWNNKYRLSPPQTPITTLRLVIIAFIFMLLMDQLVFQNSRPYVDAMKENLQQKDVQSEKILGAGQSVFPAEYALNPPPQPRTYKNLVVVTPKIPKRNAVPEKHARNQPVDSEKIPSSQAKIAIIIDDLGLDIRRTREVLALPGTLTLAFLPYARKAPELAKQGKEKGHELIIHVPMEPLNGNLSGGIWTLHSAMGRKEFEGTLDRIMNSFEGYVGINNHMGSRLTQDIKAMTWLMDYLKARNLFFVDSKTIHSSVAHKVAQKTGLSHGKRQVFLDHDPSAESVGLALQEVERIARQQGAVIAIGHPKDTTIKALAEWIPTMEKKGFEMVPVSQLLKQEKHVQDKKQDGAEDFLAPVPFKLFNPEPLQ